MLSFFNKIMINYKKSFKNEVFPFVKIKSSIKLLRGLAGCLFLELQKWYDTYFSFFHKIFFYLYKIILYLILSLSLSRFNV